MAPVCICASSWTSNTALVAYQYAYHYQRTDGALVFRYDDTPHFAGLSTFPHHKHEGSEDNVVAAPAADLAHVLTEIQRLIVASAQRPSNVPSS